MNINLPIYILNTDEDVFDLSNIITSPDSLWEPQSDEFPPMSIMEYTYEDCPWQPVNDQTCEDRRRQLWVLGYI